MWVHAGMSQISKVIMFGRRDSNVWLGQRSPLWQHFMQEAAAIELETN